MSCVNGVSSAVVFIVASDYLIEYRSMMLSFTFVLDTTGVACIAKISEMSPAVREFGATHLFSRQVALPLFPALPHTLPMQTLPCLLHGSLLLLGLDSFILGTYHIVLSIYSLVVVFLLCLLPHSLHLCDLASHMYNTPLSKPALFLVAAEMVYLQ